MADSRSEIQQALARAAERLAQSGNSAFNGATQGASMGAYDEIAALLGVPVKAIENIVTGQDRVDGLGDVAPFLGRSFQSALAGQEALNRQAYETAPAAYISGDVAGALMSGVGMAGRGYTTLGEVTKPTVANMLMRGSAEGAMAGSNQSAMVGNGRIMVGR